MSGKGFSLLETLMFIILAALVIPIFYLTTTPVIKDMMVPTSYIKARFVAERKMEELMAYTFGDPVLGVKSLAYTAPCYTDYSGYDCQLAIAYLGCGASGGSCSGYTDPSPLLTTTVNPTNYKQVDLTVRMPGGNTYRASSAVTARY
jgi:hypothetical protein